MNSNEAIFTLIDLVDYASRCNVLSDDQEMNRINAKKAIEQQMQELRKQAAEQQTPSEPTNDPDTEEASKFQQRMQEMQSKKKTPGK